MQERLKGYQAHSLPTALFTRRHYLFEPTSITIDLRDHAYSLLGEYPP